VGVFGRIVTVAAATAVAGFNAASFCCTQLVVAICVLFAALAGLGAAGVPVNAGDAANPGLG